MYSLSVVVRSSGERTCAASQLAAKRRFPKSPIRSVAEGGFASTLRAAFQVAAAEDADWCLMIDADVLLNRFSSKIIRVACLQKDPSQAISILFPVYNLLWERYRYAGCKVYSRNAIQNGLSELTTPEPSPSLAKSSRPETALMAQLLNSGLRVVQHPLPVGVEDFEQSHAHIVRKGMGARRKFPGRIDEVLRQQKQDQEMSQDRHIFLQAANSFRKADNRFLNDLLIRQEVELFLLSLGVLERGEADPAALIALPITLKRLFNSHRLRARFHFRRVRQVSLQQHVVHSASLA